MTNLNPTRKSRHPLLTPLSQAFTSKNTQKLFYFLTVRLYFKFLVQVTLYWKQESVILRTSSNVWSLLWGNSIHHCLRMGLSTFLRTHKKQINKCRVVASLKMMGPLTFGRLSEITLRIMFRCSFCWLLPTIRTSPSAAHEYNLPKLSMIIAIG